MGVDDEGGNRRNEQGDAGGEADSDLGAGVNGKECGEEGRRPAAEGDPEIRGLARALTG